MISFGLTEKEISMINEVFATDSKIKSVKIFGSRAKGNHRKNSDIDLVLIGEIDHLKVEKISSQLEDLPLPYLFDVKALHQINNSALLEHIKRVGVSIYDAK